MNKNDRKELANAISMIESAREIISSLQEGEQGKFDNLSEGLQQSERGQKFEENASTLEDQDSNLSDVIDELTSL